MKTRVILYITLLFLAIPHVASAQSAVITTDPFSDENDVRSNTNNIVITLTNDTLLAEVGTDNAAAAVFLAGFTGGSAAWNSLVSSLDAGNITLSAAETVATISIPATAGYFIDADELISLTIPSASLKSGGPDIPATGNITITNLDPSISILTQTYLESAIRTSAIQFDITLSGDEWEPVLTTTFNDSIDSDGTVWDAEIRPFLLVDRISTTIVRVTIPQTPTFNISSNENVTIKVAASNLQHTGSGVFDVTGQKDIDAVPISVSASATFNGVNEGNIRSTAYQISLVINEDSWSASVGGNNTTTRDLVRGLSFNNSQDVTQLEDAILGSDNGAANVSVSGQTVTMDVPAIPGFDITQSVQVSITVPSAATVSGTSLSHNSFATISRIAPYMVLTSTPSPLVEQTLDGSIIHVKLFEDVVFNSSFNTDNFTLSTSPTDMTANDYLSIQSPGGFSTNGTDEINITLDWDAVNGNIDDNHYLGLTINSSELVGSENITQSPVLLIQGVIEPIITGVTIPDQAMGIGDVANCTLTVVNDYGNVFTYNGGTIAGRTPFNLTRLNSTTYTADITFTENQDPQYSGGDTIDVVDLQLSNGAVSGNLFSTAIVQANDIIDTRRPVVSLISINDGTYSIGDKVTAIVYAGEPGLTFDPDNTSVNGVPMSSGHISWMESGSGIYQFVYTIFEGDADVSGMIPVEVVAVDSADNSSNVFNVVTGNPSEIDANSPVIVSVEDTSTNYTAIPGMTVNLIVTSNEVGLNLGAGSMINGVAVTPGGFTDNVDNTYTFSYTVGASDQEVTSGSLTATIVLEDDRGNKTTQVNGIQNNTVAIVTDAPFATITGGGSMCAGASSRVYVTPSGSPPFLIRILEDGALYDIHTDITGPFNFQVSPNSDAVYTVGLITDVYGVTGTSSGSASVIVDPIPTVTMATPDNRTTFQVTEDSIHLTGSPLGGTFYGNGVVGTNNLFSPKLAGIQGSPHTIYYEWTDPLSGCTGQASKVVQVVVEQANMTVPPIICYTDPPTEVTASNTEGTPGEFYLYAYDPINQTFIYTPQGMEDLNLTDDRMNILPYNLEDGTYRIYYYYIYGGYYTAIYRQFEIERIDPVKFISRPKETVCNDQAVIELEANLDNPDRVYSFSTSGGGVTGNQTIGYSFNPGNANLGLNRIIYNYESANGCPQADSFDVTVFDVPDIDFTPQTVCIPTEGGVVGFNNLTNKPSIVSEYRWEFGDINSGQFNTDTLSSILDPVLHNYTAPGIRNVSLEILTTDGCIAEANKPIDFADKPIADFRWVSDCYISDIAVDFVNESASQTAWEKFLWTFFGKDMTKIDSIETATRENVEFLFNGLDDYYIELVAVNDATGDNVCTDTLLALLKLKETVTLADADHDETGIDPLSARWSIAKDSLSKTNSWVFDIPDFKGYVPEGDDFAWYTSLNKELAQSEDSWVQSPCFDFRNTDRPMIRMDVMKSFDSNRDGAVLQYTLNNGIDWTTIGNIGEGINWYNSFDIKSKPGGNAGSSIGWSGGSVFSPDSAWITVAHDLDLLKGEESVIFGVFYATDGASVVDNQGFAFNNFFVGERSKMALIEHFTNSADNRSRTADNSIDAFVSNPSNELDVVSLQYHMHFPGDDPMNELNPAPASARSFYYGVNQVPFALMDGGLSGDYRYDFLPDVPESDQLKKLTLESPLFSQQISFQLQDDRMLINLETQALNVIDSTDLLLYVAVVESAVTNQTGLNGDTEFRNVVLGMVPSPAGLVYSRSWQQFDKATEHLQWAYSGVEDYDDLVVVGFIQNRNTGKVLQVSVSDQSEYPMQVSRVSVQSISIYPNPVREALYINTGEAVYGNSVIEICDLTGRVLKEQQVAPGISSLFVNTSELNEGTYLLFLKSEGEIKGRAPFIKAR